MKNLHILLLSLFLILLSCSDEPGKQFVTTQNPLIGTVWYADEFDDLVGVTATTSLQFDNDSLGVFAVLAIDGDTSVYKEFTFSYRFDKTTRKGKISLDADDNVYPISLEDSILYFPGSRWQPLPYTHTKSVLLKD